MVILNILAVGYRSFGYQIRRILLVFPVAVAIGSVVALFLTMLNRAINFRFQHTWLLYLLPLAGVGIHLLYQAAGKSAEKGNNLIMDEIHQPGGGVPRRMGPVVFIATVATHLFGGSAGREGTAVQIGGSMAALFGKYFKLSKPDMVMMLTAGMAAGFAAVFGTPLTGAVFAMEVLYIGRIQYNAVLPCLAAAIIGDYTVSVWGVHHTAYHINALANTPYFLSAYLPFDVLLLLKVIVASAAYGGVSGLFAKLTHWIKNSFLKIFTSRWLIPVAGGAGIILLTLLIGKPDYLSLGVTPEYPNAVTIASAFHGGGADTWSWLWKTVYTALTLGSGFKGGEVTPLFYIGATLGNTLSVLFNAPVSLFAGLGFIAVFAGATNTPVACTLMGVELFGGEHVLLYAIACFVAYYCSGSTGIYSAQRIAVAKFEPEADGSYNRKDH